MTKKGGTRDYPRIVVPPPGPKAREVIKRDKAWSSTCYLKKYPLVMSRGSGVMVEDADANRYLDFMAGIAVSSTGHAHPRVVTAVREAAGRFFHVCGSLFYFEGMSSLVERLAALAPGSSKKRVFLTNSGTEAIEGAIKLARHATRRTDLIAFKGAFHGRTYGGMSLTCSKVLQRTHFGPMLPGVHHVPFPDPYRFDGRGKPPAEQVLELIREDLFKRVVAPSDVAAVFVEPVQGEGGFIVPPPEFLRGLRTLCDEYGILLVFDEIQTGSGRTGRMWAAEHSGVEPDVLVTAKGIASGLPIGALIAKESVTRWEPGSHGTTFGGNPVACAAALATLELIESELAANARVMGERLLAGLRKLQRRHAAIGDVRGLGLLAGIELVKDRKSKEPAKALAGELVQRAFRKGLLTLTCGESVIRLVPPLIIDERDIDTGLSILDDCFKELA